MYLNFKWPHMNDNQKLTHVGIAKSLLILILIFTYTLQSIIFPAWSLWAPVCHSCSSTGLAGFFQRTLLPVNLTLSNGNPSPWTLNELRSCPSQITSRLKSASPWPFSGLQPGTVMISSNWFLKLVPLSGACSMGLHIDVTIAVIKISFT